MNGNGAASMVPVAIDAEARRLANEAMRTAERAAHAHTAHERLCTERWDQLRKAITDQSVGQREQAKATRENIRTLFNRWWIVSAGVVVLLLGIVGALLKLLIEVNALAAAAGG